jgi:hypothetical protein
MPKGIGTAKPTISFMGDPTVIFFVELFIKITKFFQKSDKII